MFVYEDKWKMGSGIIWLIGAGCIAAFGVFLRFAVQACEDRNIRTAAAWFIFSFVPLVVVCVVLVIQGDPIVSTLMRNAVLGVVGAGMGAAFFIWAGYVLSEKASAQPKLAQLASIDSIYQAGAVVGKVYGGRRSPTNATLFEFSEITQCSQFDTSSPFRFGDVNLTFVSEKDSEMMVIGRNDNPIRFGVIARVID